MKCQLHECRAKPVPSPRIFTVWWLAFAVGLLMVAASAYAQQPDRWPEPPLPEAPAIHEAPDTLMPRITAAVQGVRTKDLAALSKALQIGEGPQSTAVGSPPNTLAPLGDLDGDGVPELLLKWALPDDPVSAEEAPASKSAPLWSIYLLSWDGVKWRVARLLAGVEDFSRTIINLGPTVGRGIAVVIKEGDARVPYPTIFQVKDHTARLLWDGRADDSRYEPLLQGRVEFIDHPDGAAELIVTGRADPGLLQVERRGHRGFKARASYHWDGKAFVPAKPVYTPNEDYTIYRFISALHMRDFRSAYGLVVPTKFLGVDASTLDIFRHFIENNLPEFLGDEVFEAPEPPAASPDVNFFVLVKPDKRYVYHPRFSSDGKFLLTGLTRTQEVLPQEP